MKILIKYPTRFRPELFCSTILQTFLNAADKENILFLVSYDDNDATMSEQMIEFFSRTIPVIFEKGESKNKIHACNRDIEKIADWDILLLLSDDMICQVEGWDDILRKSFSDNLDQCLHFSDGYTHQKLQTLFICGRSYYDRFKYIYNPEYISLFSDNEAQEVAKLLNKYHYFPQVLFKHAHYSNDQNIKMDDLMRHNESFYKQDQRTYNRRKSIGFGL